MSKWHRPLPDKLWEKAERRGQAECWPWNGHKDRQGYGQLWHQGRMVRTHRVSYLVHKGEIPDGMCVCHACDNPSCVNPEHLWLGTQEDNRLDMIRKGRLRFNAAIASYGGRTKGHRTLTAEQVCELRRLGIKSSAQCRPFAERYGVTLWAIRAAATGRTWKNLT